MTVLDLPARVRSFSAGLSGRVLLADGAMGTELLGQDVPAGACLEALNLTRPETVAAVHARYRGAGADILTTNTFGANRYRLASCGLAEQTELINLAGARIARETAPDRLIAGSIGPSGMCSRLPPIESLRAAYREQAEALATGGVDFFICETFGDVEEIRAAVLGIRDISDRPVVASMTFLAGNRTPLGLAPGEVAAALSKLPVDVLATNCCVGDGTAERVVEAFRTTSALPIAALPNAGNPVAIETGWRYPLTPEVFGERLRGLAAQCLIVGGCCGTTPAHIEAARGRLTQSVDGSVSL